MAASDVAVETALRSLFLEIADKKPLDEERVRAAIWEHGVDVRRDSCKWWCALCFPGGPIYTLRGVPRLLFKPWIVTSFALEPERKP